jgi:protein CWC15
MTTAHRPTWKAAVGRAQEGAWSSGGKPSLQSSARDLAAHTKLKFRTGPQASALGSDRRSEALKESLLRMEEAERQAESNVRRVVRMGRDQLLLSENGEKAEEEGRMKLLKQTADVDEEGIRARYDDDDEDDGGKGGGWSDLDDGLGGEGQQSDQSDLDASDDDDSDLDSDDEDEEAALQAELAKIRAERAAAKAREDAEAAEVEQAQMEEAALTGNPLLNSGSASSGRLKRRWNDDVVFRNQARGEPDQNKKRFINDTVRNDFHKRFLNKFIK